MTSVSRRRFYLVLGVVIVIAAALAPWARNRLRKPNEPMSVATMYRHTDSSGDIQYFPLIAELSRGSLRTESIKETAGDDYRSFPNATLLPHAAAKAVFGGYGFPVADAVVAVAYFGLAATFFRMLGASWLLGSMGAMFCGLALPIDLAASVEFGPISATFPLFTHLWGLRIPRPYVSEPLLLLTIVASMWVATSDLRNAPLRCVGLAIAFALLVQGDIHSAMLLALTFPFLFYHCLREHGLRTTLTGLVGGSIAFAIVVSPFVIARLPENHDIPVRWGTFPVWRGAGFDRAWLQQIPQVLLATALCITAGLSLKRRGGLSERTSRIVARLTWYAPIAMVAALLGKPISIMLLGKTIQPEHFEDRTGRICSYFLVVCALLAVQWLLVKISHWKQLSPRLVRATVVAAAGLVAAGYVAFIAVGYSGGAKANGHMRRQFYPHTAHAQPTYRQSFAELAGYLDEHVAPDAVVGTLDHQVFSWWLSNHPGYSFLGDPFVSSLPDKEIEARLEQFCRLLGMSSDQYVDFIQQPYVTIFFLSCDKYQASNWYTFAPIDDYTPEQQAEIVTTRDIWHVVTPRGELARHRANFERQTEFNADERALDVIVLSTDGPESEFAPPASQWSLDFENDAFRVYRRIKDAP